MPRGYLVLSFDCDIPKVKEKLVEFGYDVSFLDAEIGWFGGFVRGPDDVRLFLSPGQFGDAEPAGPT